MLRLLKSNDVVFNSEIPSIDFALNKRVIETYPNHPKIIDIVTHKQQKIKTEEQLIEMLEKEGVPRLATKIEEGTDEPSLQEEENTQKTE